MSGFLNIGIGGSGGSGGVWGSITGTLSNQTDLISALNAKEPLISAGTTLQYWRGDKTFQTLNTLAVPELTNLYFTNARADARITLQAGQPNGLATLDSGSKIPSSQLPPIAISNTYVVASQAAMLALSANVGDVAVRTDISESFILQSTPASTLGNWIQLLSPPSAVTSVNTQTGNVVLTTTNISEGLNLYFTNARARLALSVDGGSDPLSYNSGTGIFSLPAATSSQNGYLTSTDWSTFNSKQSALTLGNLTDAGTDGITVTNGTGSVVGSGTSLSQHVADTTHNGYLSSSDWNTFNGKQASGNYITALTGDVTATGPGSVASTVAKIQGTTVSGTTGSTNVVFSTSPLLTGNVSLNLAASQDANASLQIDSTTQGILLPRLTQTQVSALVSPPTGLLFYNTTNNRYEVIESDGTAQNLAVGTASAGFGAISIGKGAGNSSSTGSSVFIGQNAGNANTTGSSNIFLGREAGSTNVSGSRLVAIGFNAGKNYSGNQNTYIGSDSAARAGTTGADNVVVGGGNGSAGTLGSFFRNVIVGRVSGAALTTGEGNVFLGYNSASAVTTGSNNFVVGENATVPSNTASGQLNIIDMLTGDSGNFTLAGSRTFTINNFSGSAFALVSNSSKQVTESSVTTTQLNYLSNNVPLQSFTINDNQSSAITIISVAVATFNTLLIDYSLIRGSGNMESGTISIISDGTNAAINQQYAGLGTTNVTFTSDVSSGNLRLRYTSTNTGNSGNFYYKFQQILTA